MLPAALALPYARPTSPIVTLSTTQEPDGLAPLSDTREDAQLRARSPAARWHFDARLADLRVDGERAKREKRE